MAIKKKADKNLSKSCSRCDDMVGCCTSKCGAIHLLGGVGLGYLIVDYFALSNLAVWGWLLVGVALVGHFWKK